MARLSRLYAPDIPQLIQVRFARLLAPLDAAVPAQKLDLLTEWLRGAAADSQVNIHGWVLLHDRLALLATPQQSTSLPRMIQAVGRRFATRLEKGRVFAERYRSAMLQPGAWVLPGLVWLDRLPVQLGYVDTAVQWPWSSAVQHTGNIPSAANWNVIHPDYWKLGNTPFERQAHYRQLLENGLSDSTREKLEQALFGQWALGDEAFLERMRVLGSRRVSPAKRGRPAKTIQTVSS